MKRFLVNLTLLMGLAVPVASADVPVTLKGSPESMLRQNEVAKLAGTEFVESPKEVEVLVNQDKLVPVTGNADYVVDEDVSNPVARPEMRMFIERLAAEYHEATGEKLVVTSLTRPSSHQPSNSHKLSVHPTGLAVDFRISDQAASRQWLENTLLSLESKDLLDVTREKSPPHYHVALFPDAYRSHVEGMLGPQAVATALLPNRPVESAPVEKPEAELQKAVEEDRETGKGDVWAVASLAAVAAGISAVQWKQRQQEQKEQHND